jgi:Flp pilus assembly protein TadD
VLCGQASDPAYDPLAKAYEALLAKHYNTAIELFHKAIEVAPDRAAIRKDLAYVYLRVGETEAARDQFAEAMRLEPEDIQAALEYAFLCHETGETATARRIFDHIRKAGDPTSRATAEKAFHNIDRPLAQGIARWSKALRLSPDDFSAHHELARLAEQREEFYLAAEHYQKAWQLRPDLRSLLLGLGRVWKALGLTEQAHSALLAASRGAEPRVAEKARELLPDRYPFVYEFRQALELDPTNVELHRELAFLLLRMGRQDEAEQELATIMKMSPDDLVAAAQLGFVHLASTDKAAAMPLLDKVLNGEDPELADRVRKVLGLPQKLHRHPAASRRGVSREARTLADRSYEAGYLKDALKYYSIAHESDPLDFPVMLQLGWTHNILGQDRQAIRWFEMARRSPDPAIAAEARKAYKNLRPSQARFRTTTWVFPTYSSRWRDVFSYGQIKAEIKLGALPLRGYLSSRFIGDTRQVTSEARPQYLSESSLILGAGLATDYWHGLMLWAEAGSAVNYDARRRHLPRVAPDYRGGLSFSKGFGRLLGAESSGAFFETNDDGVYVSRFQNDVVLYSQNRLGCTFPAVAALGGLQTQFYWNGNVSADLRRQYWANVVEFGPGVRFRWKGMPPSWVFSVNFLRGAYTLNESNPRGPNFFDLRVGVWYSLTR